MEEYEDLVSGCEHREIDYIGNQRKSDGTIAFKTYDCRRCHTSVVLNGKSGDYKFNEEKGFYERIN